jgi:hypothetical protein
VPQGPSSAALPLERANILTGETYELGMLFSPRAPGFVRAARFYKPAAETGTHVARLWREGGTLLATATFTAETASGWQEVAFNPPIFVRPGPQAHMISVNANNAYYGQRYTHVGNWINGNIMTYFDAGKYGVPGEYPTQSFLLNDYGRDVVFVPASRQITVAPPAGFAVASGDGRVLSGFDASVIGFPVVLADPQRFTLLPAAAQ